MATVPRQRVGACDGYLVEAPRGPVGWVEETWLGPDGETAAFAVRTVDGQRGLMLAEEVLSILEEDGCVVARADARLLELDAPRVDGAGPLHASWSTTGATLEAPAQLGAVRRVLVTHRRLPTPPAAPHERPLWQIAALLYVAIAVLAGLFMLAAFAIAAAFS